jgi:hypothetical protein
MNEGEDMHEFTIQDYIMAVLSCLIVMGYIVLLVRNNQDKPINDQDAAGERHNSSNES